MPVLQPLELGGSHQGPLERQQLLVHAEPVLSILQQRRRLRVDFPGQPIVGRHFVSNSSTMSPTRSERIPSRLRMSTAPLKVTWLTPPAATRTITPSGLR